MQKILLITLSIVCAAGTSRECVSQVSPGAVEIHAEALAIGVALTLPTGSAWSIGVDISGGKLAVVNVTDDGAGVDTYATGYLVVRWSPNVNWQAVVSPIGIAAVVGNDFGVGYPSARIGASYFPRRLGVGSELRIVRIAGGKGAGHYWIQWVPVRVALRL